LQIVAKRQPGAKSVYVASDVELVVSLNDKKRFEVRKLAGGASEVRASQGHTMRDVAAELGQKLSKEDAASRVPFAVHGTYEGSLAKIRVEGLCRFKRNHVHLAKG
jgi:RNA:NAD 2'-phosphotransferase (TPT1/KptA family)